MITVFLFIGSESEEVGQAPRTHQKYHVTDDVTSLKYGVAIEILSLSAA